MFHVPTLFPTHFYVEPLAQQCRLLVAIEKGLRQKQQSERCSKKLGQRVDGCCLWLLLLLRVHEWFLHVRIRDRDRKRKRSGQIGFIFHQLERFFFCQTLAGGILQATFPKRAWKVTPLFLCNDLKIHNCTYLEEKGCFGPSSTA